MAKTVTVVVDEQEVHRLVVSRDTRDLIHDRAKPVERAAKLAAPKDTGRGARSIRTEMVLDGDDWEAHTSWGWPDAFYMYWHEKGSRHMPARPFLEPALKAAR
jgi:HK97 gp10 family phage protein